MTDAMTFLQTVAGFAESDGIGDSTDRPIKLAVIDPSFDPNTFPGTLPKVIFEGESTVSGKFYAVASPYWPQPNDKVWMVPIGSTYLIVGSRQAGLGGVYIGGQIHIPGVRKRIGTSRLTSDSPQLSDETVVQSVQGQLEPGRWYEVGWETEIGITTGETFNVLSNIRADNIAGSFLRRKRQLTGTTSAIYQAKLTQEVNVSISQFKTFVATLQLSPGGAIYRNATGSEASMMYIDYVREV